MSAIASGENRLDERPSRGRFDAGVLSGPAAIAVAIVAQLTLIRRPEADIGLWLYLAAIAILILGSLGVRASPFPEPAGRDRADTMSTLVLVFAALLLRLVLLTQHPGIFGDEGERGMEARHILEGARPPLAGYGWWGVPNVYFYLVAGFLRLAGDGLWGLRLFSAASGVAAVFFVA